ncbi:unnamed protein product [Clavelina lepadiformis]|uniref:Uncharacterized protein n=1 Tax=Clavelina lepadiformis TaxID=159417 RepID=A0ABP0G1B4_CLALP
MCREEDYSGSCEPEYYEGQKLSDVCQGNNSLLRTTLSGVCVASEGPSESQEDEEWLKTRSAVVEVLRDTGCSGYIMMLIIRRNLVRKHQLIGRMGCFRTVNRTLKRALWTRLFVDTTYFCGTAKAICLPNLSFELVIGNLTTPTSTAVYCSLL